MILVDPGSSEDRPEGSKPTQDICCLLSAFHCLGVATEMLDWERAANEQNLANNAAVLPLMVWSYSRSQERYEAFVRLLRRLHSSGTQPSGDLGSLPWIAHKRFLLELAEAGVAAVPTILLHKGSSDADLRAAKLALRSAQPLLLSDAGDTYVVKPAVGGAGDGVELLPDEGAKPEREFLCVLAERDMLIQPFLPRVRTHGEVSVHFTGPSSRYIRLPSIDSISCLYARARSLHSFSSTRCYYIPCEKNLLDGAPEMKCMPLSLPIVSAQTRKAPLIPMLVRRLCVRMSQQRSLLRF